MITELCVIMNEEGSDKSDLASVPRHNYTIEYFRLFDEKKLSIKNVFEVGLGTNNTDVLSSMGVSGIPGASLRGWSRYFTSANIYGADVDKRILFQDTRIKTFYVDQTNKKTIHDLWENEELRGIKFDIMIDDGLHDCNANIKFFENSFHKLEDDGYYIIEDVQINTLVHYQDRLNRLKQTINFIYEIKVLPHPENPIDNCLIIITKK